MMGLVAGIYNPEYSSMQLCNVTALAGIKPCKQLRCQASWEYRDQHIQHQQGLSLGLMILRCSACNLEPHEGAALVRVLIKEAHGQGMTRA